MSESKVTNEVSAESARNALIPIQSVEGFTLLQQWLNGIKIGHVAHSRAAADYHRCGLMLGVPTTILSIVVGTSVFSAVSSSKDERVLGFAGVMSILAAVLSGLQTFLNYPELAAKHQDAGYKYGQLRRRVEEIKAFTLDPKELQKVMPEIREAWQQLET